MEECAAEEWGDRFAVVYDQLSFRSDEDSCVELLASLAGNGKSVLELGVGTGRIALPMAAKGYSVTAVDGSAQMLEKLRAKPGSELMSIVCGNFVDVAVEGTFALIYIVYNTLTCILSQKEQLRCFCRAAEKLSPEGAFVVETPVLSNRDLADGMYHKVAAVTGNSVVLLSGVVDRVRQLLDTQLTTIDSLGTRLFPSKYRYVWPSELDLMAEIAGMRLDERWSTWDRRPFTSESSSQISVFRRK